MSDRWDAFNQAIADRSRELATNTAEGLVVAAAWEVSAPTTAFVLAYGLLTPDAANAPVPGQPTVPRQSTTSRILQVAVPAVAGGIAIGLSRPPAANFGPEGKEIEALLRQGTTEVTPVLIDSNAVTGLAKDATLGGRLASGETGIVSYVTGPELRNAAAKSGGKFFVPKALNNLPVLNARPSLDLIINLRGQMARTVGRVGDGIIGAQAIENGFPLITNDAELARIVFGNGGVVR
jgi:predicted nucleic acid-binding protein